MTYILRENLSKELRKCVSYHLLSSLLAVHESLGDDAGGEDLVALTELLEEDPVGESESADPDALQDAVAAELVQDQVSGDLPRLLLVVWDDAAYKVRLGGAQRVHQLAQLLLHRHLVKK